MAKIKNLSREPLDFITGFENGEPVTEALRPGEEKDIKTDVGHAQVKGRVLAGLISIAKEEPAKTAAKGGSAD